MTKSVGITYAITGAITAVSIVAVTTMTAGLLSAGAPQQAYQLADATFANAAQIGLPDDHTVAGTTIPPERVVTSAAVVDPADTLQPDVQVASSATARTNVGTTASASSGAPATTVRLPEHDDHSRVTAANQIGRLSRHEKDD